MSRHKTYNMNPRGKPSLMSEIFSLGNGNEYSKNCSCKLNTVSEEWGLSARTCTKVFSQKCVLFLMKGDSVGRTKV